ncbi:type II toxin-antitoxin system RelE/ParE family toxin [Kaistella antarctica]
MQSQILNTTKQLVNHPSSGQKELLLEMLEKEYRYILSGNYKIIYKVEDSYIIITDVFDARQNPSKMNGGKKINSIIRLK